MHKTRASRAQIFQSFDALKGFREILKEKERIIVPKKILSEDDLAELDCKVHQIKVGMMVKVTYYDNNQYIQIEGKVSKINLDTKMIQIVKTKLDLKNVIDIKAVNLSIFFSYSIYKYHIRFMSCYFFYIFYIFGIRINSSNII